MPGLSSEADPGLKTKTGDRMLLRMRGISKSFSGQPALAAVDFELRAGEVHVLAGENRCSSSSNRS